MFDLFGLQIAAETQIALGVALLGGIAIIALVLWWAFRGAEREARDRARRLSIVATDPVRGSTERAAPTPKDIPSLARLSASLSGVLPAAVAARTNERLARAGRPLDLEAADFIALRFLCTTVVAVAAAGIAWAFGAEPIVVGLVGLAGALVGYAVPGIVIDRTIRGRRQQIVRAMPAALDMLALSTAAGLTLDGAMTQVVQRWDTPLSWELRRYLAEVQVGRDRRTSLREMARRMNIQDVTRLSAAIIQADALGLPIAQVLREQASEMRRLRRQRAEEAARSAPVKMVFPLVLLIFPALFVVVLGPAVPRILELFRSF